MSTAKVSISFTDYFCLLNELVKLESEVYGSIMNFKYWNPVTDEECLEWETSMKEFYDEFVPAENARMTKLLKDYYLIDYDFNCYKDNLSEILSQFEVYFTKNGKRLYNELDELASSLKSSQDHWNSFGYGEIIKPELINSEVC